MFKMIEEKIIVGEGTDRQLNGLLTLPDNGNGPFPVVVLVHGSGPSDMDGTLFETKLLKDLATMLVTKGIATIRYDKRTRIYGKEMYKDKSTTVYEETIEDALLATKLVEEDQRFDKKRKFILGHSMGGMLAPRIDDEGGDYTGIIIMAGSPRRLEEIILDQSYEALKKQNKLLQLFNKSTINKVHLQFINMYKLTEEKSKKQQIMGRVVNAYYLVEWGRKSAIDYLKKLKKPILIMQGKKDFHISIEKDYHEYKSILVKNKKAEFKLYPDLNHVFMESVYDDPKKAKEEYSKPQHLSQEVVDDIAEWILDIKE
jgi:dienelactone hydrolase